jgi:hypothetical protein
METLRNKYGDHKVCEYTYPWFLHALGTITKKEITSHWKINIKNKPIIKYIKVIEGGTCKRKPTKEYYNTIFSEYNGNGVYDLKY